MSHKIEKIIDQIKEDVSQKSNQLKEEFIEIEPQLRDEEFELEVGVRDGNITLTLILDYKWCNLTDNLEGGNLDTVASMILQQIKSAGKK